MKKYQSFFIENFLFLEVRFSLYLNRRVFIMACYALRFSPGLIFFCLFAVFCINPPKTSINT